jgi:hypothetical protein
MRFVAFFLIIVALPGLASETGNVVTPITLYTQFQVSPPAAVLDAIESELHQIMSPLGFAFEWRALAANDGEASSVIAVATFGGSCIAEASPAAVTGALGWTHVTDGEILPFSEIDCDRIRTFLASGLARFRKENREEAFGRAVGRVLAHELYHVLARTAHHGTWGVAKAAYTAEELLSRTFRFEAKESHVLRLGWAAQALEHEGGAPPL